MQGVVKIKVVAILLMAILGVYFLITFSQQRHQSGNHASVVKPIVVSHEEYIAIRNELFHIVDAQNPTIALEKLTKIVGTDSAVLRSCHALTHEIGNEAYKKYQDFGVALEYKDEICNSGYMHGVIESAFITSKNVYADMRTVCNKYPLGKFLSWECYHGIGHGVMYYTSNNLPLSLYMCHSFTDTFMSATCTNGVFMENFNTDQKLHPSKFLNAHDPFYPCPKQSPADKANCYLYAPTYFLSTHMGSYKEALVWCRTAEDGYQQVCAQGVGMQAIKENIYSPQLVEAVCDSSSTFTQSCISGMVSLYVNQYGRVAEAQELCPKLDISHRETCEETVAQTAYLF